VCGGWRSYCTVREKQQQRKTKTSFCFFFSLRCNEHKTGEAIWTEAENAETIHRMNLASPPSTHPAGNRSHSPSKDVRAKVAKATELESRYMSAVSSSAGDKNESNIQQLRVKLCEQFSDILLTDPFYSNRKDISGRMWRACFHGRVQELRDRIAKEKARLKKIQHKTKSQSTTNPGPDEEAERQQQALIDHLEKNLNTFLKEAVVLYEFLIDKYQGFLLPHLSSQMTQTPATPLTITPSKVNVNSPEDNNQESSLEGVVPLLHKMFIHLGDLLRYCNSFTDAETAYLKATRLAPGRGNAYNQLAVIGQIKDTSAPLPVTVLYWYCRSLLATDDPFPTALANMERFFTQTCKETTSNVDTETTLSTSTAGLNREKARALKGAKNRKFLQAFTHFHGQLFFAVSKKENCQDDVRMKVTDPIATVDSLLSQFDWLLEESAFSDALLNKLIVINVSSIWNLVNAEHKIKYEYTMIAVTWLLEFSVHLMQQFTPLIDKVLTKQTSQGVSAGTMSLRFFTPILFVFEFVSNLWSCNERFKLLWDSDVNGDWDEVDQQWRIKCEEGLNHFWSNIVQIANVIRIFKTGDVSNDTKDAIDALPLDHGEMRGFMPFESFLSDSSPLRREIILSPKEAVVALQLDALNSQTTSRGDAEAELSSKISRFLFWVRRSSHEIEMNSDGLFSCRSNDKSDQDYAMEYDQDSMLHVDPIMMDKLLEDEDENEDEGAGDHVVYKVSATGTSLLVPVIGDEPQPILPSIPKIVRPPPGFLPMNDREQPARAVPASSNIFSDWNSSSSTSSQTNMHSFTSNPFFYPMPPLGQDMMNRDKTDDKAVPFHPFQFSSPFSLVPMNLKDEASEQRPFFTHNPFFY